MSDAQKEAEELARLFHDTYERLAPAFGYATREETRVFDPDSPNGRLMIAVCNEAVAARLQERDDKIAEMKQENLTRDNALFQKHEGEIADLRAKLVERDETLAAVATAGSQAMTDLHNLSLGIVEIFFPNFHVDGIGPACSTVEMVKSEIADLRAKLEAAEREVERLKALDKVCVKVHNDNLLEMGDLRTEAEKLKHRVVFADNEFGRVAEECDDLKIQLAAAKDELGSKMDHAAVHYGDVIRDLQTKLAAAKLLASKRSDAMMSLWALLTPEQRDEFNSAHLQVKP